MHIYNYILNVNEQAKLAGQSSGATRHQKGNCNCEELEITKVQR